MPEGPLCALGDSASRHSRIATATERAELIRKGVDRDVKGRGAHYNDGVLALRYVYVLALAVWLGGMVILGAVVAPATFQVLQASEPVTGRLLGGAVFGAVLARFHFVAYAAGALALLSLTAMALLGPRPRAFAVRSSIVALMLLTALYSGFVVLSEVDAIQQEVSGLPSSLPAYDARRIRFDRLHQLSTQLMIVNIVGALVLLYWEARET
jgi:uncharacterized membrane protein